jgi:para-aminobenzoate synthetase component I
MEGFGFAGGRIWRDPVDVTSDLSALDGHGSWLVVLPFTGQPVCVRFATVTSGSPPPAAWNGPDPEAWSSNMDQEAHEKAVRTIRDRIAAGDVYQVNLCRLLSAPYDGPPGDLAGLAAVLSRRHAAPFAASLVMPRHGIAIVSTSPELFVSRDGAEVESRPIKGTASSPGELGEKDRAENVMIVDLVRNDFGRVCEYGSIAVPNLFDVEEHPGLFHLVSTVKGQLRPGLGWAQLLDATFPPGSVTGAPKLAALDVIEELEPDARGPYCGSIGWVDADDRCGELNVAIRTFWLAEGRLRYGTGGAITWDSTPAGEWAETELKTRAAVRVADGGLF